MISCQPVISCVCMSLFNISYITDDILSARYKLAQYYLREFTEISLFSEGDKVPLPKLYVAMKWKRYTNDGAYRGQRQQYRSFYTETKESDLAGYKDIFKKVGLLNLPFLNKLQIAINSLCIV